MNRLCRPDEPVPIWQNSQSEAPIHTVLSAFVPGKLGAARLRAARPERGQKADQVRQCIYVRAAEMQASIAPPTLRWRPHGLALEVDGFRDGGATLAPA